MPTLHSATAFDADDLDGNDLLVTKSAVLIWLDAAGGYDGTAHFEFSPNRTTWFDITGEVLGEGASSESVDSPTDEAYVLHPPLNSWIRVRMSDGTQGSLTVRAQNTTVETQGMEATSAAAAVSIANGADVTQGSTTDAAVVTDANGTVSGKLRGLVKWAFERMPTSLGGKTAAASFPVTTATDDPLIVRLGEVTASPAENTVLDRLKDLLTGIILAAGSNLIGKVAAMGKVTTDGDTAIVVASATEAASSKASTGMLETIMRMLSATGTVQPVLSAGSQNDGGSALTVLPMAQLLFNGSSYDRRRSNHEATVLASAARTTATNSSDLVNYNARGVVVTVDVTAIVSSPSLTVSIKYKDTLSGKYVTLLTSAAIATVSTTRLIVYPGVTSAANLTIDLPLPRVWRVEVAVGNADSATYSISANYIG